MFVIAMSILYSILPRYIQWPVQEYPDAWKESSIPGPFIRNEAWVNEYMYKISTYKELGDGIYSVNLLAIEDPKEETFEELCDSFNNAKYSIANTSTLHDGVNCQGMTFYIVKWCESHGAQYAVDYYPAHVNVSVFIDDAWYLMDFSETREIVRLDEGAKGE